MTVHIYICIQNQMKLHVYLFISFRNTHLMEAGPLSGRRKVLSDDKFILLTYRIHTYSIDMFTYVSTHAFCL